MSRKTLALVIGLLAFTTPVAAEDDVVVDLSVLDHLNNTYMQPAQPLFPVLPETSEADRVKKAPVRPAAKPKPVAEPLVKSKPLPPQESKAVVVEPPVRPQPAPVEAAEPVVVVDVEPAFDPQKALPVAVPERPRPQAALPDPQRLVPDNKADVLPVPPTAKEPKSENVPPADILPQNTAADKLTPQTKPALLIDETAPVLPDAPGKIVFADGVDELTALQKADIDKIVAKFKNTEKNKIAIYSYNLDDGVDSFRKKRLSLNRAIGIRSYLLQKGYKNFSIKVININTGSDKINTVELEEI